MRRFLLALTLLLVARAADATTCAVPYTFVNGTTADGGQVSSDLTAILGCINSFGSAGLEVSGGDLIIDGSNSGKVTVHPQANAGTWNLNLPTTAGSSGQAMLSGGGGLSPMTFGTLGVAGGGTGLAAGVSGGIPAFTGTTTITSSALLTQHALMIGGGAAAAPYPLASLGTATTVLHGAAAGDPTWAAIANADLTNSSLTIGTTSIALGATSLTLAGLTSVNKVAFTAPATSATLTVADGKTLTASNTLTLAGVDAKTLTFNNSITFAGTDATTMTFPSTSQTVAGLGVAQTFTAVQTINLNAASLQAASAGTVLHVGQATGTSARLLLDAYAASPIYLCRRADTSAAAPSAVQVSETLCTMSAIGYGLSAYSAQRALFSAIASEIWTDTAQGSYWNWQTTATGGTTTNEKMRLNASGNLSIGDTTDTDKLHVTGAAHLTTSLKVDGATSGTLTVLPAAVAGANTLTLPAGTTDFSATGGTSQVVKQTSAGAALTVARLACADLSDAGANCTSAGKTLLFGNSQTQLTGGSTSNTFGLGTTSVSAGAYVAVAIPVPYAGTLKNLNVLLPPNGAPAGSYTMTLIKNGSLQTITCSISPSGGTATCTDSTHTVSVVAGDLVAMYATPASTPPASAAAWSVEFDPS